MGLMDMFNKVVGAVQNVNNTAQNAKYTYDQAKNTVSSMTPNTPPEPEPEVKPEESNQATQ